MKIRTDSRPGNEAPRAQRAAHRRTTGRQDGNRSNEIGDRKVTNVSTHWETRIRGTLRVTTNSRTQADPPVFGQVEASHSDRGAVLILALVYIIAISLVVGALARWATDDLNNTNNFSATSELHTAVTSAMDTAINSIRYTPWPSGTGSSGETVLPTPRVPTGWGWCFQPSSGTVSSVTLNTFTVDIYCNTVANFNAHITRVVTLAACLSTTTAQSCEANPLLSATVEYEDYPVGGARAAGTQCNVVNTPCGYGQILESWIWL